MNDFGKKRSSWSDEEEDGRSSTDAGSESSLFEKRNWRYTEQFLEVMKTYQESTQEPSIRALNLRGRHSWDEVLEEARACEAKYHKAGRKWPRKLVRSFSAKAEVMKPWIELIPSEMCLDVLSGGLKLVFGAATRINDMQEDAINQLLRIPSVIADAEDNCKTYGRDGELLAHAERLYQAALVAIEGMTQWLQQRTASRHIKSIFRGPLYSRSFQDKIKSLDAALSALQGRVSILQNRSIRQTEHIVRDVKSVLNEMSKQEPETRQKLSNALEDLKEMLEDKTQTAEWMNTKNMEIWRIKKQIQQIQRSKPLSREDLLEILGVDKTHPECDLRRILRRATPEDDSDKVALGVTRGQKFSQWHQNAESAALFIEGTMSSSSDCEVPFTSLISSFFIESVKPHAMCIYFFCGHHTRSIPKSADSFSGPSAMMRSLIAQTIRESTMKIDFISSHLRSKLESLDFRALCLCFQQLVQNLPIQTVLFCIIDGVSDFERRGCSDDCKTAIDGLQDLTCDFGMDAIFKLLVTSPSRSRKVRDSFKPEDRLQLESDDWNDRDGRDFPTERQIMEGSRRPSLKQHLRYTLRDHHLHGWPEEGDHDVTAPSDSC